MTVTPGSNTNYLTSKTFTALPFFDIAYTMQAKIYNQQGNIVYEYNPFHNMRDSTTGQLVDFVTTDLNFNLNNPVEIEVQQSYDGSVNVILNDNLNPPRMINSRFTVLEDSTYEIPDRTGNAETNIYEEQFLPEVTMLYKTTQNIPYMTFLGLYEGGAMPSGNYVFYFKYADADGNESDLIAESGIVSCYIGKLNDPFSTRGGIADELTNKIAKFTLNNLDTAYDYLNIYFTRASSDYNEAGSIQAYKILTRKTLSGTSLNVTITGLEDTQTITLDELNLQYNVVQAVQTQTQVQNLLLFGNVTNPTVPFQDLQDLALRIYPTIQNDNNIGYLDQNYIPVTLDNQLLGSEYYDASNVYKYTGYWNKEMYRLAVVFIMKDDTLSPAFNIRGKNGIDQFTRAGTFVEDISNLYTYLPLYDDTGTRQYIPYDDNGWITGSTIPLENARGVVRISCESDIINKSSSTGIYPLSIALNIASDTLVEMQKFVKGFFLVRQKRIPTILCQGLSIGVDSTSFIPTINASVSNNTNTNTIGYITEAFIDKSNQVVHDFSSRLLFDSTGSAQVGGLLCPEAILRQSYFNEIFTAALFNTSLAPFSPTNSYFTQDPTDARHFYLNAYSNNGASTNLTQDVKLTLVQDNQPLRYSGTKQFSTRVGIPEEAYKFSWFGNQDTSQYATNLIRGNYAAFVGSEGYSTPTSTIDIHTPGYNLGEMEDYFLLRANSFHPFYAISDRYDLNLLTTTVPYSNIVTQEDNIQLQEYRGDCFIGTVTVRMLRNFQDPDTPINDIIIDPLTWKTNYTGYTASGGLDATKVALINTGDVNAVEMGHWCTFKICSNVNLAYRAIDDSNSSEMALTGKARSFYPYAAMAFTGESKIPESTITNVGYNTTTSDKVYITEPDVPFIKNFFDNRIMYSEISVNDAFRNGYRVFKLDAYKDVTMKYGSITKLLEWQNNLTVVFETGVALIPINEKMIGAQGNGNNAYIYSSGVLPDIVNPLSTNYGSTWKDSVLQTPDWIYGVDATAKKIWRTNGRTFEVISDFKIQAYLNANLTLTPNQKGPVVALQNIKTHYNAFKKDVMFTFVDMVSGNVENTWSLCYNEVLQTWVTRFSWMPLATEDIQNIFFSFNREDAKVLALVGLTLADNPASTGIVLDTALINEPAAGLVGTFALKGYDYYAQYTQTFTLDPSEDYTYFTITENTGTGQYQLEWNGQSAFPKFFYTLRVRVGLSSNLNGTLTEVQHFYDYIAVLVNRDNLSFDNQTLYDTAISSWFWKHGQAGIFDTETVILPTNWYGKQEVFEFEFIVVDNPGIHKVFDNLAIIANNAQPDSFEFEVVGSVYTFPRTDSTYTTPDTNYYTTITPELVHTYQKALPIKAYGRSRGNIEYKEDFWDVEIKPIRWLNDHSEVQETRLRDKYCRIRVRYSGTELALINALTTVYTQSYA